MIVPERRKRSADDRLLLRADVGGRHRNVLGRHFANAALEREGRDRSGEAGDDDRKT